ncbi:MAG TPA: XrtA/PEP-CTERM system histidine kinase PrsK [Candidatus Deferrimicrobiaceae bacterium]|jgi:hypothetical protein
MGVFILSRNFLRSVNRWFAIGMASLALTELGVFIASRDVMRAGECLLPVSWLMFALGLSRDDLLKSSPGWRAGTAFLVVTTFYFIGLLVPDIASIFPISPARGEYYSSVFIVLGLTLVLAAFETTLRASAHTQRWRIKFLLLGVGVMLLVRIYANSQQILYPSSRIDLGTMTALTDLVGIGFVGFSLVRHRLFEVDVFVSRYFVYNSFTVLAIGAYLLVVGLTAQAIRSLGGSFSNYIGIWFAFIAVLGLLSVFMSTRVQKQFKSFINRHFYRNRYDYHKEWLALTARLSSTLDPRSLLSAISEMLQETVWIEQTTLWLCDEREGELHRIGATADTASSDRITALNTAVFNSIKMHGYPVKVDDMEEVLTPEMLPKALESCRSEGISVLVPLVTGDRLVGVLGCGKSRSGHPFDREDLDLLNTVARQAANSFLIAQWSENLLRAKEMEDFHSFSAFVLHDMKNFVSMLSLVVQNAERNLDDPEFRKDAIHSIAQTVEKMKKMMEHLAGLSRDVEPDFRRTDLSRLTAEAISEVRGSLKADIREDLGKVPETLLDGGQIKRVLTNLLLNANDAMAEGGEIHLSTAFVDGKLLLTVSDDGCGMTPDYVDHRLFKPFSTTKSNGFGIGLYQTKGIIEAHGGRIDVESILGKGTSFRISLPVGTA